MDARLPAGNPLRSAGPLAWAVFNNRRADGRISCNWISALARLMGCWSHRPPAWPVSRRRRPESPGLRVPVPSLLENAPRSCAHRAHHKPLSSPSWFLPATVFGSPLPSGPGAAGCFKEGIAAGSGSHRESHRLIANEPVLARRSAWPLITGPLQRCPSQRVWKRKSR